MPQILGKEYKFFSNDHYKKLMPQIIKAGFMPISIADLMRAILESVNKPKQKKFWLNGCFDTGDGVAYYKDKIKIVPDAKTLREIQPDTSETTFSYGGLLRTLEQYKALEGEEFLIDYNSREHLKRMTKLEVKSSPIWKALARDNHLLSEYADFIFAEVRQGYDNVWKALARDNDLLSDYAKIIFDEVKRNYDTDHAMDIYLTNLEPENPIIKAWTLYNSPRAGFAIGSENLDCNKNLIGLRAEDASKKETLDEKVTDALKI